MVHRSLRNGAPTGTESARSKTNHAMLKPSQNPPMLSSWVSNISDLTGRWWIAHTKARQEKALARDLHEHGVGYFLPLREKVIVSGGRKRRVLNPLFPSYVFFCGDPEARRTALATNRLCQTIDVTDQAELVTELLALERVLSQGAIVEPLATMTLGRRYRITSGPFSGLEGPVVRVGNASKIALKISAIAQGALLEIEAGLLEPID